MQQNPKIMKNSLLTTLLILLYMQFTGTTVCAQNDKFVPTAEELAKYLPQLAIGDMSPELKAANPEGNVIDLKDMRGSYVVIDFWATWCGDCRREIPALKVLYSETKDMKINDKPIQWLGFSYDYNAEAWKQMLAKEQLPWPQISNLKKTREDPTFNNWGLRWIPAFFLIGPDGTILGTAITADGLRKVIEQAK